ncbi:hypothetical protein N0V91_008047 [Didymella pomorum]|uniref:Uncharacterized protein n=1 Tax=Didymella pomorum TaxID=749634 RepID=A0A9W8Z803_9PLEO|nr:hypothetical protein N0V91_008047 [Didymella pomorum]
MKPEQHQHHMNTIFKNCKGNTLELPPAAFPSLRIDQARPEPPRSSSPPIWWRRKPDSDDWTSTSSHSPPSPLNPRKRRRRLSPRQTRNPYPCEHRSPPPKTTRQSAPCVSKAPNAPKSNETGLIFEPSPLRDPHEVRIVNKATWNTLELWYTLPPVALRKAGRVIQGEYDRLQEVGAFQQRAFRPKNDAKRKYTTWEVLVAQEKVLETKLQILKYKKAKLRNFKKPSILPPALGFVGLRIEEQ